MARIRTIKPEFWTSEQVMECSRDARLLFIGLWNFCDDSGNIRYSSKKIKALIFPSDDLMSGNIHGMVLELESVGLISLYAVDNEDYLSITGWHHQRIDKPQKSKIPPPPKGCSTNIRGTLYDGRDKEEGKGSERKKVRKEASRACAREGPEIPFGLPEDASPNRPEPEVQAARSRACQLRTEISNAYEAVNFPGMPDTARAETWIAQGYDAQICAAVVRECLAKKPGISSLSYYDKPIKEAHEQRAKNGNGANSGEQKPQFTEEDIRQAQERHWRRILDDAETSNITEIRIEERKMPAEFVARWRAEYAAKFKAKTNREYEWLWPKEQR